jgi:hypothetical protein
VVSTQCKQGTDGVFFFFFFFSFFFDGTACILAARIRPLTD